MVLLHHTIRELGLHERQQVQPQRAHIEEELMLLLRELCVFLGKRCREHWNTY